MPRSPPEDEIDWKLKRIISDSGLPPKLRGLSLKRYRKLLQAIAAMDTPEAQTKANIQKFAFNLQQAGVVEFSPTDIYLGGRYDELRKQELDELVQAGLLETRSSKMRGLETEVYKISDEFKPKVNAPRYFKKEFQAYKDTHNNLRNPFEDHDRNVIIDWAIRPRNYLSIDRQLFERARHGDTDQEVKIIEEAVSSRSPNVKEVDRTYRPFAATIEYLVREFKTIHSLESKKESPEDYERSVRMFDLKQAQRQFRRQDTRVVGDPVLYVGIVEPSLTDSLSNYWKLWKGPQFEHSIPIDFDREPDVEKHRIRQHSIGVLGYLDEQGQDLVVRCLALLESDDLPPKVIDYQRERSLLNSQANQSAQLERVIDQLHEDIEVLEGEDRKHPRRLMRRLNQATTIEIAREELLEFQQEYPELAWLAERAIRHLNL